MCVVLRQQLIEKLALLDATCFMKLLKLMSCTTQSRVSRSITHAKLPKPSRRSWESIIDQMSGTDRLALSRVYGVVPGGASGLKSAKVRKGSVKLFGFTAIVMLWASLLLRRVDDDTNQGPCVGGLAS